MKGFKPNIFEEVRNAPKPEDQPYNAFYDKVNSDWVFPIPVTYKAVKPMKHIDMCFTETGDVVDFYIRHYTHHLQLFENRLLELMGDLSRVVEGRYCPAPWVDGLLREIMTNVLPVSGPELNRDEISPHYGARPIRELMSGFFESVRPRLSTTDLLIVDFLSNSIVRQVENVHKIWSLCADLLLFSSMHDCYQFTSADRAELDKIFRNRNVIVSPLCSAIDKSGASAVFLQLSVMHNGTDWYHRFLSLGGDEGILTQMAHGPRQRRFDKAGAELQSEVMEVRNLMRQKLTKRSERSAMYQFPAPEAVPRPSDAFSKIDVNDPSFMKGITSFLHTENAPAFEESLSKLTESAIRDLQKLEREGPGTMAGSKEIADTLESAKKHFDDVFRFSQFGPVAKEMAASGDALLEYLDRSLRSEKSTDLQKERLVEAMGFNPSDSDRDVPELRTSIDSLQELRGLLDSNPTSLRRRVYEFDREGLEQVQKENPYEDDYRTAFNMFRSSQDDSKHESFDSYKYGLAMANQERMATLLEVSDSDGMDFDHGVYHNSEDEPSETAILYDPTYANESEEKFMAFQKGFAFFLEKGGAPVPFGEVSACDRLFMKFTYLKYDEYAKLLREQKNGERKSMFDLDRPFMRENWSMEALGDPVDYKQQTEADSNEERQYLQRLDREFASFLAGQPTGKGEHPDREASGTDLDEDLLVDYENDSLMSEEDVRSHAQKLSDSDYDSLSDGSFNKLFASSRVGASTSENDSSDYDDGYFKKLFAGDDSTSSRNNNDSSDGDDILHSLQSSDNIESDSDRFVRALQALEVPAEDVPVEEEMDLQSDEKSDSEGLNVDENENVEDEPDSTESSNQSTGEDVYDSDFDTTVDVALKKKILQLVSQGKLESVGHLCEKHGIPEDAAIEIVLRYINRQTLYRCLHWKYQPTTRDMLSAHNVQEADKLDPFKVDGLPSFEQVVDDLEFLDEKNGGKHSVSGDDFRSLKDEPFVSATKFRQIAGTLRPLDVEEDEVLHPDYIDERDLSYHLGFKDSVLDKIHEPDPQEVEVDKAFMLSDFEEPDMVGSDELPLLADGKLDEKFDLHFLRDEGNASVLVDDNMADKLASFSSLDAREALAIKDEMREMGRGIYKDYSIRNFLKKLMFGSEVIANQHSIRGFPLRWDDIEENEFLYECFEDLGKIQSLDSNSVSALETKMLGYLQHAGADFSEEEVREAKQFLGRYVGTKPTNFGDRFKRAVEQSVCGITDKEEMAKSLTNLSSVVGNIKRRYDGADDNMFEEHQEKLKEMCLACMPAETVEEMFSLINSPRDADDVIAYMHKYWHLESDSSLLSLQSSIGFDEKNIAV